MKVDFRYNNFFSLALRVILGISTISNTTDSRGEARSAFTHFDNNNNNNNNTQVRRLRSAVQPQASSRNAVERSSEGVVWIECLDVSSDSNSFANRFSSSSYVDPPSFNVQLAPTPTIRGAFPRASRGRAAGRTRSSSFHSKRQPAVAIKML